MVKLLAAETGLPLKAAADLREAMQSLRPFAEVSSALRNLALELNRIANDLRLLGSGTLHRAGGNLAARGRPGLVHHAGQGQSEHARDAQPGLLPGDGL